jgi:hypothetical protein
VNPLRLSGFQWVSLRGPAGGCPEACAGVRIP